MPYRRYSQPQHPIGGLLSGIAEGLRQLHAEELMQQQNQQQQSQQQAQMMMQNPALYHPSQFGPQFEQAGMQMPDLSMLEQLYEERIEQEKTQRKGEEKALKYARKMGISEPDIFLSPTFKKLADMMGKLAPKEERGKITEAKEADLSLRERELERRIAKDKADIVAAKAKKNQIDFLKIDEWAQKQVETIIGKLGADKATVDSLTATLTNQKIQQLENMGYEILHKPRPKKPKKPPINPFTGTSGQAPSWDQVVDEEQKLRRKLGF